MSKRNYTVDAPSDSSRKIRKHMEENNVRPTKTLLDLDFYCLIDLFNRLQLPDKLRLALTCQQFFDIYVEQIAPKYKILTKDDILFISQMKQDELSYFFHSTGQIIEKVDIYGCRLETDILLQLFRHGKNIKKVTMGGVPNTAEIYFPLLIMYGKSVEQLTIKRYVFMDDNMRELSQLPNLRALKLASTFFVTGKYLAALANLEELYLAYNERLKSEHLQEIAQSCTKLRILDIREAKIDVVTSQVIAQNCHSLETLWFSNACEHLSDLAKLPNLRRLALDNTDPSFLRALVKYKADQLEDLRIYTDTIQFASFEAISQLKNLKILYYYVFAKFLAAPLKKLCSLKNLERLAIRNGTTETLYLEDDEMVKYGILLALLLECSNLNLLALLNFPQISEDFVFKAIDVLQERRNVAKEPNASSKRFVLVVHETNIQPSIFQNEQYLRASSILKLHIIPSMSCCDYPFEFPVDFFLK